MLRLYLINNSAWVVEMNAKRYGWNYLNPWQKMLMCAKGLIVANSNNNKRKMDNIFIKKPYKRLADRDITTYLQTDK